ncbi:MAG TPA: MBL fold metallo-hydrolase [Candidatus Acidoferrales bacterium]|nr:MBL fold metallo-hydrolase [Candidatus Acidoferrales bacterium]
MLQAFFRLGCLALLAALPAISHPQAGRAPLEVTYIANEGFLLTIPQADLPGRTAINPEKVIIDGLFREGVEGYAVVPPTRRDEVETARPPFDAAKLVLVSHHHADHFDAAAVARYLVHNFRAVLVSSPQVCDAVAEQLNDDVILRNRVRKVSPQGDRPVSVTIEGITVQAYRVSHGSGRHAQVQNLGHLVTLGGWKILHIGDSDADELELKSFGWAKEKIDVAFIPFWYLADKKGSEAIKRHVRARIVVAMHIPPEEVDQRAAEIRAFFPDAIIFAQPFETMTFQ